MRRAACRDFQRRGAILVLSAILMIVMMTFVALSVDVGYMNTVQTEMDRSVDASALAGVAMLPDGAEDAEVAARYYASLNAVGNASLEGAELTVTPGHWDGEAKVFTPDPTAPSALKVDAARLDQRPLFFARVWGHDTFQINSSAIAVFEPRDIMVVQDYSASMNDDSEFRSIGALGRETVENNLLQIYGELGSPSYGNGSLEFAPNWMTVPGNTPNNSHKPQIYITHRYNSVVVQSTKQLSRVKVYGDNGQIKTTYASGVLQDGLYTLEVDAYNGSRVKRVQVRSGYKYSPYTNENRYYETIYFDSSSNVRAAAKKAFGLNGVSWPYPSGSWDSYIDYCTSSSSSNRNKQAGYRYRFGYMNWVNFLLEKEPAYNETPVLWQVTEQPITAVKNAVNVFIDHMEAMNSGDRVGLAAYNSPSGWGQLEQSLTENFSVISSISEQRQAGHYHNMTNIAAGLDTARNELETSGRQNVAKRIVLMTDGVPTYPQSSSYSRSLAIAAAQACADAGIPVTTISLGSGADVALMQQIADMTDGLHFNVPGGRPISEVQEDLLEVFDWVAADRPVRLVATD